MSELAQVRARLLRLIQSIDADGPRTAAMVTALRYARDHRLSSPRCAFDFDEWARLVDAAIGPYDPAAKVPDTYDLEAARLAVEKG